MKPANSKTTVEEFLVEQATHWNAKEVIEAWQDFIDSVLPISSATPTKTWMEMAIIANEPDMSVGGATKKPRKPRRRKEVTADKFIVVRVTSELYEKVQSASDLAGVNTSKWVRQAVLEQLSK